MSRAKWEMVRKHAAARRASNIESSRKYLQHKGIEYTEPTKGHLVIPSPGEGTVYDFWPAVGLAVGRSGSGRKRIRGVKVLAAHIQDKAKCPEGEGVQ